MDNLSYRMEQILKLEKYIIKSNDYLDTVLMKLEWNRSQLVEQQNVVTCPNNYAHKIPPTKLAAHLDKCNFHKLGYEPRECLLSEPLHDPISSIYIDNEYKRQIFESAVSESGHPICDADSMKLEADPQTADRYVTQFSRQQRLLLYNEVIGKTKGPASPPEYTLNINSNENDSNEATFEQHLIDERNSKRRRIKHKSVHTNKKNYTEILREVIDNNMDLYTQWIDETISTQKENIERERKHATEHERRSNSRSRKSSKSRSRHRSLSRNRTRSRSRRQSKSRNSPNSRNRHRSRGRRRSHHRSSRGRSRERKRSRETKSRSKDRSRRSRSRYGNRRSRSRSHNRRFDSRKKSYGTRR